MSELMTTAASITADTETAAIRAKLIGDKMTIAQLAAAFGVTDRAVYNAIEEHRVPFVKIFNVRYLEPSELRQALVKGSNSPARGRGRPRKAA
jgi:hypothetical protein